MSEYNDINYEEEFLTKVKEFVEECLDHEYDIEKFNLKESYPDSLLRTTYIGGSRGGDCWGGRTCEYDVGDHEIVNRLSSDVGYVFKSYFSDYIMVEVEETVKKSMADYSVYSYIAKQSDYSDYYGNHDIEGIFEIPVFPIAEILLDKEYFEILKNYVNLQKEELIEKFNDKKTNQKIEEITKKIETFESEKEKELSNLKGNVEKYESILKSLKEEIKNFPTTKTTQLNNFKRDLKKLKK